MAEICSLLSGFFDSKAKHPGSVFSAERCATAYEIEFFEDDFDYTVVNGVRFPIRKNVLFLARPGDVRSSKLHFCCFYLHLVLSDGALRDFLDAAPRWIPVSEPDKVRAVFERLALLSLENETGISALSLVYTLAALMEEEGKRAPALPSARTPHRSDVLGTVTAYIDAHYAEPITLSDLAALVKYHPNYLDRLFRRVYGETPMAYLLRIRLARAKYLLTFTTMSVGEIADACGFSSQTYFSALFTREVSLSPTAYRKDSHAHLPAF